MDGEVHPALAAEPARQGHRIGHDTVTALSKAEGFSLQGTSRTTEGPGTPTGCPVPLHQRPGQGVQRGRAAGHQRGRQEEGDPGQLRGRRARVAPGWTVCPGPAHDFPENGAFKAVPYGIYDIGADAGWVSVGCDGDTAAFAVAALYRSGKDEGQHGYPHASRPLITADAGGSNGCRVRAWKNGLATFAHDPGLEVTACHFPPGTRCRCLSVASSSR